MKFNKLKRSFLFFLAFYILFSTNCKKHEPDPTIEIANITTVEIKSIKLTTAECYSIITDDKGYPVTERGVCWSKNADPTINNSKTSDGDSIGTFISQITGLEPNTNYYARSFAITSKGTSYGNILQFKTIDSKMSDIEHNEYKVIQLGNQVWMAENLKVKKFNDATDILEITDNNTWFNATTSGYCRFFNQDSNLATYGALYNWYTVNTNKLCPTGWHVPSTEEWSDLANYLGGASVAGGKMKETGKRHWYGYSTNVGATNESGFTALPGGFRGKDGVFYNITASSHWWTSTFTSATNANNTAIYGDKAELSTLSAPYQWGFSVRCVKD